MKGEIFINSSTLINMLKEWEQNDNDTLSIVIDIESYMDGSYFDTTVRTWNKKQGASYPVLEVETKSDKDELEFHTMMHKFENKIKLAFPNVKVRKTYIDHYMYDDIYY